MRVIAGEWRGRPLIAPKGDTTRPTADRTREALFSMLTSRLGSFEELRVLDLFAGSGALGLEALSRGAEHCTFIEQDGAALDALRANIAKLNAAPKCDVRPQSVMALGPSSAAYDLVLLDPPYNTGAGTVALERLRRLGWIAGQSLASVETHRSEAQAIDGYDCIATRIHGKARISLYRTA